MNNNHPEGKSIKGGFDGDVYSGLLACRDLNDSVKFRIQTE
jgi:hypothetical protein